MVCHIENTNCKYICNEHKTKNSNVMFVLKMLYESDIYLKTITYRTIEFYVYKSLPFCNEIELFSTKIDK